MSIQKHKLKIYQLTVIVNDKTQVLMTALCSVMLFICM